MIAGTATAIGAGIDMSQIMAVAAGILVDGDQRRHTGATHILAAHQWTGALWRNHEHVDVVSVG